MQRTRRYTERDDGCAAAVRRCGLGVIVSHGHGGGVNCLALDGGGFEVSWVPSEEIHQLWHLVACGSHASVTCMVSDGSSGWHPLDLSLR
jgi:hypothetical protein